MAVKMHINWTMMIYSGVFSRVIDLLCQFDGVRIRDRLESEQYFEKQFLQSAYCPLSWRNL